jgi:hypothetical protein
MHAGRAGCDDNPVQFIANYSLADGCLARFTACVFIVAGNNHHRHFLRSLNYSGDIHSATYIGAAVTDKYAYSGQVAS